jgi:type III secretion protein L
MAIWLTHGPCTVGFDDGLIRAADFARLVESSEVADAVEAHRAEVLAAARRQGKALVERSRREAHTLLAEARARLESAHEQGLRDGLQEAASTWAEQELDAAQLRRRQLLRQSERLSEIVSMAVERVIEQENSAGLYRRSLREVLKLVRDAPMLTLRVPPADHEDALRAVTDVLAQLAAPMPIEVVSDAAMPAGGCRFESDGGVIDASLDTQLMALRRAVNRAVEQMARGLQTNSGAPDEESRDVDDESAAPNREAGGDAVLARHGADLFTR